jgi:MerR family transcriptional regulator, redox-sensitive transcriptional activator SoxR
MLRANDVLPIGDLARRTGLSVSAIRFYEAEGLIAPRRSPGGQRRFLRADIRRLSFIMIVQQLGFPIREIKSLLKGLPEGRTPTQSDWASLSRRMKVDLDARIVKLARLRDQLDGCIGCGCLSLKRCALYNAQDRGGIRGTGPIYLTQGFDPKTDE